MVKDIKNLLYATDLSKNSAFAFRYALKLANCFDASITVLYILPIVDSAMEVPIITQMGEDKYYKLREEKTRETIEGIKERIRQLSEKGKEETEVKTNRVSSILVHEGDTVEEILITSDELNSDMIILGSHGKGILKHTFLGTVPEKVLRRSRRPVLIVPIPKGITDIDL
ncbi:MAG: universal stress protein [Thermodesulfobacteriota bacterium]|nr:universal stress protein [Thermodesulfobacteriota bacterium]